MLGSRFKREPRAMAKWTDHREAVRETLRRRKKSIYWLHAQLSAHMSRSLLYDYLRGDVGISREVQAKIIKALSLRFTDE